MITLLIASLALPIQGTTFTQVTHDASSSLASVGPVKHLSPTDLNANHILDFVHRRTDTVLSSIDPSFANASVFANFGATAATALRDDTGFYFTNSYGLLYASHVGSPWVWSDTNVISGGDWMDARSLELFDVDGIAGPDLLGVSFDRHGVLLATDSGAGFQGSALAVLTTAGAIDDVIAYHYHPTRAAMIVASTSVGLECFHATGAPITTIGRTGSDGRLAVLPVENGTDRFAWLTKVNGDRWLDVYSLPFGTDSTLDLPDGIESMASGNLDSDSHADLVFGGAAIANGDQEIRATVLTQTANGTFSTAPGHMLVHTFAPDGGNFEYEPFLGDADGDGDGDIVVVAPNGQMHLAFNNVRGLDAVAPLILETSPAGSGVTLEHAWLPLPANGQTPTAQHYQINIRIDAEQAPPVVDVDGTAVTANHVEWLVWESVRETGGSGVAFTTTPWPLVHGAVDIRPAAGNEVNDPLVSTEGGFFHLRATIYDAVTLVDDTRYVTLRFAARDSAGNTVARWPARQFWVADYFNDAGINYLANLPGTVGPTGELLSDDPSTDDDELGNEPPPAGTTDCTDDYPDNDPPGGPGN